MKKLNYCITHNTETEFPVGERGECVIVHCPPPDFPILVGDFVEPDSEELAQMDVAAEELLADLTGE